MNGERKVEKKASGRTTDPALQPAIDLLRHTLEKASLQRGIENRDAEIVDLKEKIDSAVRAVGAAQASRDEFEARCNQLSADITALETCEAMVVGAEIVRLRADLRSLIIRSIIG